MADEKNDELNPEALQAIIGAVFEGLANATKGGAKLEDGKPLPESVTDMVARSLEAAGRHEEAQALRVEAAEQLAKGRKEARDDKAAAKDRAADFVAGATSGEAKADGPDPIKEGLEQALGQFVVEKAEDGQTPAELLVDQEFLAEHGSELAGRMLGAFAKAIIPDEPMEMDLPVNTEAGQKDVKVKIDLAKMLSGFLKPVADAEKAQGKQGSDD